MNQAQRKAAFWLVASLMLAACGETRGTSTTKQMLDELPPSGDLGLVDPNKAKDTQRLALRKGRGRGPTQREASVIAELMRAAERVRERKFLRDVPVLIEDRERITAYVESQIEEEDLERARVVYTALGLLPEGLDVKSVLLSVMGEQIVGYYDAKAKRLVVRDDVMRAFTRNPQEHEGFDDDEHAESEDVSEARIVLVHELVHALQDQHLGLSARIDAERTTDADNAFHALVEGDATLAMIGYALEGEHIALRKLTGNPAQVRSLSDVVRTSPLAGSELERAPAIVRVPLLSAYIDGLAFNATLHGGAGWTGVDQAHQALPTSTEHILHPERFARGETPETLALPQVPSLTAAGFAEVRQDTLGELEIGVYFAQAEAEEEARRDADGWDGDRLSVYANAQKQTAVLWLTAWDSERDADEARRAAQRVLDKSAAGARTKGDVARSGTRVLILRDFPEPERSGLLARFGATGFSDAPPAAAR